MIVSMRINSALFFLCKRKRKVIHYEPVCQAKADAYEIYIRDFISRNSEWTLCSWDVYALPYHHRYG